MWGEEAEKKKKRRRLATAVSSGANLVKKKKKENVSILPAPFSSLDIIISGSAIWNCWSSLWPRGKAAWEQRPGQGWQNWETERAQVLDDIIESWITRPVVWIPPTSGFSVLWNTKFPYDLGILDSGCPALAAKGIPDDPYHGVGLLFWAHGRITPLGPPWLGGAMSHHPCELESSRWLSFPFGTATSNVPDSVCSVDLDT